MRSSWEQGTAAVAITDVDDPEYSVFASSPFTNQGFPASTLRLAMSASVRQTSDGRLSQQINDALDGAALDGASAGSAVMLGSLTDSARKSFWLNSASAELNFVLTQAPRTSTGAISHRVDSKEYWSDGVFMGFPFIAYYGAMTNNQSLLMQAYTQCQLYRNALLMSNGPTGPLWAHIRDDSGSFIDQGLWASGNGWAAQGMLRVQAILMKSSFASSFTSEINDLKSWVKQILDGTFKALNSNSLIPDYIQGGATFGDASASAALAAVAFRSAVIDPQTFGSNYTNIATQIMTSIVGSVDNLGLMNPVVDPLNWGSVGTLSTEAQAFGLMMMQAYLDWVKTQ
ncbi:hypothetical protein M422DRAFT_61143 [Sphaerobolus stellatus SS14]|uniref:Uncharacterized protein n=1 Tax=Sphaerobolus stellatus (strain SS14) TaxID=990650 RepID=A0A0C9V4N4_SPHS4|nr:hypothetical protein M422DRAFT_61143 [Sphaerobolus stellatus SS14]